MGKKLIGSLYGTVTGDASSWINELKRADDATRTRAASIGGQVSALGRRLSKDFTVVNLGRGLLGGLGIGSAAGVAMTAIDHFAGMWRESNEHAGKLDDRAESIAKSMGEAGASWREMTLNSMPPEKRLLALQSELVRKMGEVAAQEEKRTSAISGMALVSSRSSEFDPRFHTFEGRDLVGQDASNFARQRGLSGKEFGDMLLTQMEDAQKRAAELRKEVAPLVKEISGITEGLAVMGRIIDANELTQSLREAVLNGPDYGAIKEISREDEARASAEVMRYREELRDAAVRDGEQRINRIERESGLLEVDQMTRRGMSSGGNYKAWNDQTNTILAEMRDLLRSIRIQGIPGVFGD